MSQKGLDPCSSQSNAFSHDAPAEGEREGVRAREARAQEGVPGEQGPGRRAQFKRLLWWKRLVERIGDWAEIALVMKNSTTEK